MYAKSGGYKLKDICVTTKSWHTTPYTYVHGMRDAIPLSVMTGEDLQLRHIREGWTLQKKPYTCTYMCASYTSDSYLSAINNSFVI